MVAKSQNPSRSQAISCLPQFCRGAHLRSPRSHELRSCEPTMTDPTEDAGRKPSRRPLGTVRFALLPSDGEPPVTRCPRPPYQPRHLRGVLAWPKPRGSAHLGVGFALRCFQRFSVPDIAIRRRPGQGDRHTSGRAAPVLSYWERLPSTLLRPRRIETELSHDVLNPARVPL